MFWCFHGENLGTWLSFEVIDPLNLRLDYEIKPQLMDISTETLVS